MGTSPSKSVVIRHHERGGKPFEVMDALRRLHRLMVYEEVDRATFTYRNNRVWLDVVFIVDEDPFVLLIGVRGERPYSFELSVRLGYRVPLLFNEQLKPLMDALGIRPNPGSPFRTSLFLEDLNRHVLAKANHRDMPTGLLARRATASGVEEADKVSFVGWVAHGVGRHISDESLHKTRRLLGLATAVRCRQSNVSSRWSAIATDRACIGPVPDSR